MAYGSYHPIWFEGKKLGRKQDLIIAGPVCESGDVLTQKNEMPITRKLPKPSPGDIIIIGGVGAYGYAMSSNYNTQPLLPEVIVEKNKFTLSRRRQTLKDMLREEI